MSPLYVGIRMFLYRSVGLYVLGDFNIRPIRSDTSQLVKLFGRTSTRLLHTFIVLLLFVLSSF
jgi:hypothetical protein